MKLSPAHEFAESIAKLLKQGDSAAAAELAALAESPDKAFSKSAKKALYTLSQRGIRPPVRESDEAASPQKVLLATRALMSNIGGTGSRMLWFVREDAHGGSPMLMSFLLNDQTGVIDLSQRKIPRKELEERIESFKTREKTAIADVPIDYGRFVLAQAAARNLERRHPLPQGYAQAFRFVGEPVREHAQSPVCEYLDADEVRNDGAIQRAPEKLFELPWFEDWLLEFDLVEPWESKYFEAVSSQVLIDESQRAKRGDVIIDEAAESLIDADSASRYRLRLEDSSLVLHLSGHAEEARQVLYHALTLGQFQAASKNPFLRTLVHRSIFLVIAYKAQLEEQAEKARPGSGLIHRV